MRPFDLPEFYRPWPPRLNPHVADARAHNRAWAHEHGLIDASVWDEAEMDSTDLALFAAYCFPDASRPMLDLVTDWWVWGFFFDDWFLKHYKKTGDVEGAAAWLAEVREFMPADLSRPVPEASDPVQAVLAELWARTVPGTSADWRRRFGDDTFAQMGDAFWELENLSAGRIPNPIDYLERKRGAGAGRWVADLVELVNGIALSPGTVASRPVQVLRDTFTDAQLLLNDIFSYQREIEEEGEIHNYVLVLQHFLGLGPQRAANTANDLLTSRLHQFENTVLTELPVEERAEVLDFARALQDVNSGSHEWHLRSSRYMNEATRGADPRVPVWRGPTGLGTSAARLWASHRPVDRRPPAVRPAAPTLPERRSPHLAAARAAASAFAYRTGIPGDAAAQGVRAALSHPDAPRERLETVARWYVLLAHLDEHLDLVYKSRRDLAGGRAFLARLPAFLPSDGGAVPVALNAVERGLAELWPATDLTAAERSGWAAHFTELTEGRSWELANALQQRVPDAVDYLQMRRRDAGLRLDLIQYAGDLPADTRPAGTVAESFADAATAQHDLASYRDRIAVPNEVSNGVLVVERLLDCAPQRATDVVADLLAARLGQVERAGWGPDLLAWLAGAQHWRAARPLPAPTGPGTKGVKAWQTA